MPTRHSDWTARWNRCGAAVLGSAILIAASTAPVPVLALGDPPPPVIDCRKKQNKSKPQCRNQNSNLTDDEIYSASYVLAQQGDYVGARALLTTAADQSDPRILNYLGFTTRKLGDPAAALPYYLKALDRKPDYALARSYLGEAYIALGRIDDARTQLTLIEGLCGTSCEPYTVLAQRIAEAPAGGVTVR